MSFEQNQAPRPQVRQTLLSGRDLALDLAERVGVLALFALFVHRMLPRLSSLVLIEMARPELITQAADINAQALLLVIGEGLGVLLIVLRRSSATLSRHPLGAQRYYPYAYLSAPQDNCEGETEDGCELRWREVDTIEGDVIGQCVAYCPWQD